MQTHARVVIIGGGIAGCSALYHLTQEGWRDVMLLERDELTSGTTWHSAAQVTNFGAIPVMLGLKSHSIKLYQELANDPDYPINYHYGDGGLRLAGAEWHMEGYRHFISVAKGMGVDLELVDAQEAARRHPLIIPDGLLGALWDPHDGDIDPAQLCQALARRARKAGASVHRHTPVTALRQSANGEWVVTTPQGDITCEHIVNAGGYRCNEIAAMMGVELPVASMEHQYFVTEAIPEIEAHGARVPLLRCPTDDFYSRQEKNGLLVGFYEQDCKTWGLEGVDPNFTNALCPDDLERILPVLESVFKRMPALEEAGIHTIINGPITYTPDGVPLVGRIGGKRNAWCITGLRAGVGEGGGHGWLLAQQMVHGQAELDMWALDPRRFGRYATQEYTALKAVEDYQNEFRFHRPHEHRPAGRNMRTTPLTPLLAKAGAAFAPVRGWERADFYKPRPDFREDHGFGFTNAHEIIKAEVETVQSRAGLMEVCGFGRIEITGPSARDWLDGLICGRVPKRIGKVGLGYYLTDQGDVAGEATLALIDANTIWWGCAAAAIQHDWDWLSAHLPEDSAISMRNLSASHNCLVIAGPRAREILKSAAPRDDWGAFPWLTCRKVHIGPVAALAMAVSYSGEDAFELHFPIEHSLKIYDALIEAGAPYGLAHFGLRAAESMRIEKGYLHWKAELITEFDPFETGLERFVDMNKDFPGKAALAAKGGHKRRQLVMLRLESDRAPAHSGDAVLCGGRVVGMVSSAAWGYRTGENLALAFISPDSATESRPMDRALEISISGSLTKAQIVPARRYDPGNNLMHR